MAKKKGLKTPAVLVAAPTIMEAGKTAESAAKKVNQDTHNSLSWLAVAVAGIGVYAIYKVVYTLGKGVDAAGNVLDGISDAVTTDPSTGGGNVGEANTNIPDGATINGVQAETIASQLANIMGTFGKLNEAEIQQILNILSGKTPIDYIMISNAFGMVRRNPITGEIAPPLLGQKLNLTHWLTVEMRPEGIARLRQVMPGVF